MANRVEQSTGIELRTALLNKWVVKVERKKESRVYDISSLKDEDKKKDDEMFNSFMGDDWF